MKEMNSREVVDRRAAVWEREDGQRLSLNRTQPLHKATPTGVSQLYNQIARLLPEEDMQGPMVAMQPQVAEVYNFCTK